MAIYQNKNVLKDTRCLVIGSMEKSREHGNSLRNYVEDELKTVGIKVWNHYKSPIHCTLNEGDDTLFEKFQKFRDAGDFESIAEYKQIRHNDLALIDKCDFVICELNMGTLSCGTWEELFLANRHKKPIFVFCPQGKKALPLWMWWTLPINYFYDDIEQILDTIRRIDDGTIEIDSDRWKLLKPEYR